MRAQKISKFARRRNGEAASERARQGKRREGRKEGIDAVRQKEDTRSLKIIRNLFLINFQKQNKLHKHNNQFLFFLLARWQIGKIVFACWFVVVVVVVMLPLLCCSCAGLMRALHYERRRRDRDDNDDS
jgi:hypothetical protein